MRFSSRFRYTPIIQPIEPKRPEGEAFDDRPRESA
jgi:hypothetical protein